MPNIVAISGSPLLTSRSSAVIELIISVLEEKGFSTISISVHDIPPEDLVFARFESEAVEKLKVLIEKADGVIIATPIYKASYTGILKSMLDLLPQDGLAGKVVLPIATGGTIAHLLAIDYALKPVLSALGARNVVGGVYIVDSQFQKSEDGQLRIGDEILQRLHKSIEEFTQTFL